MARRSNDSADAPEIEEDLPLRRVPLEPIGVVERELTRPDGTKLKVEVPVYPPFRLEHVQPASPRASKGRSAKKPEKA